MRPGLTVRVNDNLTDRNVTGYATGLKFKYTAPGGLASASCTLALPARTFTDLGPADRLYVYESSSGDLVWEGYTDNPGANAGSRGEGFELSATGPMARAADERRALLYADKDLTGWSRSGVAAMPVSATAEVRDDPTAVITTGGLVAQFANGNPVTVNNEASIGYSFENLDNALGAIVYTFKGGKTDANYVVRFDASGGPDPGYDAIIPAGSSLQTGVSGHTFWTAQGVGHPKQGRIRISLTLLRVGAATNVADDLTWNFWYYVGVAGQRMNRYGVLLQGSAGMGATPVVRADQVAEDLLGRLLTFCNPYQSVIDVGSVWISQLAYRSGTTAAGALDDLSLHEPNMLWEILPSRTLDGRHVFKFRYWPVDVRYEISVADGYNAPGGDNDLSNRITIDWTDATQEPPAPQVTVCTVYVKALADAGITRDAERVALPDGMGSQANAQRIGDAILAISANPPKAATAVVNYRILDRTLGRLVDPWLIRPGYMARVRETGEVLRLTEVEYDHDTGAATLTLGTPVQTPDQIIAKLGG